jgi:galactokinase
MHEYAHDIERIALTTKQAIESGDITTVAKGMKDAQASFDRCAMPNCPSQLTSPKLHSLMSDDYLHNSVGILAIKGIGSQGDGSAQLLCTDANQQQQV